jgi:LysM repeat protein
MKSVLFIIISIFVLSNSFGQKTVAKNTAKSAAKSPEYIMHIVKFGETLTKIAKLYGVTITDILNTNPSLTENSLMPEQIIRISNKGNKKFLSNTQSVSNTVKPKEITKNELTPKNEKYHTVVAGQTMYAISKMYNITVEDLQKWNNFKDFNLKLGSQIIVSDPNHQTNINQLIEKKEVVKEDNLQNTAEKPKTTETKKVDISKTEPVKLNEDFPENTEMETQKPDIQASDNATQKDLAKIFKEKAASLSVQTAKGTGAPMTTTLGAMETVYFAMHKWLPIGTIIKIKNLVNSKIVYAKVIGKLPDTDENKHVIVRYSLGIKKDLQLQNGKCYVQIEYPV